MILYKNTRVLIKLAFAITLILGFCSCENKDTTTYYFDNIFGDDNNLGTSKKYPFKSLSKIKDLSIKAGDSILLSNKGVFTNPLELQNVYGTSEKPIVVSSYKAENKVGVAKIAVKEALNNVSIENSRFIKIHNLLLSGNRLKRENQSKQKQMQCGLLVKTSKEGIFGDIVIDNCIIENIFFEKKDISRSLKETKSANGTQNYGWGMRFINRNKSSKLNNINISNCIVQNVSHTGIKFTAFNKGMLYGIENINVSHTRVIKTGGPGIQMSGVKKAHISNNIVDQSGSNDDSRKWGRGSGLWTWGSRNILIEHNRFSNANGPGDSAGAHIDFNCNNVILQYNVSLNNAGGFCEILGNNYNCAYRYNISINDGHRVKGKNNAFQEGKLFWLSGYQGNNKKRKGPFNSYFYNNTMYVSKDIVSKFAINSKTEGILIANNIFYIEDKSKLVKGDQYKPDKNEAGKYELVFFKNNLFLKEDNWPKQISIRDENPFYGDPFFKNKGGFLKTDYIPANKKLIQDKGIVIPKIPKDSIGIIYGLRVDKDILGNPITNTPDIGAIEISN